MVCGSQSKRVARPVVDTQCSHFLSELIKIGILKAGMPLKLELQRLRRGRVIFKSFAVKSFPSALMLS